MKYIVTRKYAQMLYHRGPVGEYELQSNNWGVSPAAAEEEYDDTQRYSDNKYFDFYYNQSSLSYDVEKITRLSVSIEKAFKNKNLRWQWDGTHDNQKIGFVHMGRGIPVSEEIAILEQIAKQVTNAFMSN